MASNVKPLIFPGYKGGDPSSPYSIRLPEIISEEQFNSEVQALFAEDQGIKKLERARNKMLKDDMLDQVRAGLLVDKMKAKVKEWTKEYIRVQRRLNYYKAQIARITTKSGIGYHKYRPITSIETQIRTRKIRIIKEHADRQWSRAREEFARNWDKRSAAKYIAMSTLNLDKPKPKEIEDL